jgi:hypothetical protein
MLFPSKWPELRELAYWLFAELFEDTEPVDEAIKVVQKLMHKLPLCKQVFI